MEFEVGLIKCPSCRSAVDLQFLHFTSLMGPTEIECHWCGKVVKTDRMEWWEMPRLAKAWFFGATLLYVALASFLGGLSINAAVHLLETGQLRNEWGIGESTFWIGGLAWGLVVVLIQVYRVVASLKRKPNPTPLRRSFWSFQIGGQAKFFFLLVLIPAGSWLVALLRSFV